MMRLSRRHVILGLAGAAAAAAGGAFHWRRVMRPGPADIAEFLEERLAHLPLVPGAAMQFAEEYHRRYGSLSMSRHHRDTLGGLFEFDPIRRQLPAHRQAQLLAFERRLVSYFLRSTDYFLTPPGSPVRYVRFPDPYEGACANPLANLAL
ncbi:MAG TPA: hypothetical protein VIL25_08570 [Vicinamibacterales bacterium]